LTTTNKFIKMQAICQTKIACSNSSKPPRTPSEKNHAEHTKTHKATVLHALSLVTALLPKAPPLKQMYSMFHQHMNNV